MTAIRKVQRERRSRGLFGAGLALVLLVALSASTGIGQAQTGQAPRSVSPPTIEGSLREGQTVTAGNGRWDNDPTRFTYQWQRCDSAGQNCANLQGETARTYRIVQADVDRTLRVIVTAYNTAGQT